MGQVRTFEGYAPPARIDGVPFTNVDIQESATGTGSWSTIDNKVLSPLDTNPANPLLRSFTTNQAAVNLPAFYRLVWKDAANNTFTGETINYLFQSADGYPSLTELLSESSNEALTGASLQVQTELRSAAIAAVERYTHQRFVQEGTHDAPVAKVLDADGGDVLWLPQRMVELVDFIAPTTWLDPTDVALDPKGERLYITPLALALTGSWLLRAQAQLTGVVPRHFPMGNGVVTASGVWGWLAEDWQNGTLDPVRRALRYDMEDKVPQAEAGSGSGGDLEQTVEWARAAGVDSISQGGLSFSLTAGEPTASSRVRRELDPFVWEGRIAAVA